VAHVIEDVQGLLPGGAGGLIVAAREVTITEVRQNDSLVVAVAAVAEELERLLEAPDGIRVLAQTVVGVAEAIPGTGRTDPVAAVAVQVDACWQQMSPSP